MSKEVSWEIRILPHFRDLYFSALNGEEDKVSLLLQHNADPNGINKNGFTPLHAAAFKGRKFAR